MFFDLGTWDLGLRRWGLGLYLWYFILCLSSFVLRLMSSYILCMLIHLLVFITLIEFEIKRNPYQFLKDNTDIVVAKEASKETTEIQKEADSTVLALTVDWLARFLFGST